MGHDDFEAADPDLVRDLLLAQAEPGIHQGSLSQGMSNKAECPGDCLAHRQHIYILCYGGPTLVRSRDYLRDDPSRRYPISHYVGWTSQLPPIKRVRQHGAQSARYVAQIRPGTVRDEEYAKRFEPCPRCSQSLWYYAESPTYSDEYANNAAPGQGALLRRAPS